MTTPLNSLNSQSKDSNLQSEIIDTEKEERINKFLKTVPHLEFSATGIKNIADRFCISAEYLNSLIFKARKDK